MGQDPGYLDLGYARLDTHRANRTGDPEVVLGDGKSPDQIVDLLGSLASAHPERAVLATRLAAEAADAVRAAFPDSTLDPVAPTAVLGPLPAAWRPRSVGAA